MKHFFDPEFERKLINNLNGLRADGTPHCKAESKPVVEQKVKRPPTIKQLAYLKKLGVVVSPGTSWEASVLIDKALGK